MSGGPHIAASSLDQRLLSGRERLGEPILKVEALNVRFRGPTGYMATVVDEVAFSVGNQQVFGIAGESGSGKTLAMMAILGLLPSGALVRGRALYRGTDLLKLGKSKLRRVRGKEIAVVFQDPLASLHPMLSIEAQLTDHVRHHLGLGRSAARKRALDLLGEVRIPSPLSALRSYPHQLSGGMRQRVAIAVALACEPRLLIADEPTTALDVTVQAGILRLIDQLRHKNGLSVILITHDLGVMAAIADTTAVLYAGRIVESGITAHVLGQPRHPYTKGLINALPKGSTRNGSALIPIRGTAPSVASRPDGCAFHPRCEYAQDSCKHIAPKLADIGDGRMLACPVDPLLDS